MSPSGWLGGGVAIVDTCLPIIPTFVLPYKRYAGPTLLSLAAGYVERDRQSYRKTASPGGRVTGYVTPPGAARIDAAIVADAGRSNEREQLLRQSRQLLHLAAEWDERFPEKFFPRFATRSGFS